MSKPQHGGVRDPNKQENNIQYRMYYRNDHNRDKNNRRTNYRFNTGYGGEQQIYNRNTRQDNSNNVITFRQANINHLSNESAEREDAPKIQKF